MDQFTVARHLPLKHKRPVKRPTWQPKKKKKNKSVELTTLCLSFSELWSWLHLVDGQISSTLTCKPGQPGQQQSVLNPVEAQLNLTIQSVFSLNIHIAFCYRNKKQIHTVLFFKNLP